MKKKNKPSPAADSKPLKVLLHMARQGGDWAGKATHFEREEQYSFGTLQELFDWLENPDAGPPKVRDERPPEGRNPGK
jgi:hypothetical protein